MKRFIKALYLILVFATILCFISCQKETQSSFDYAEIWNNTQSGTLQFQYVVNSTEKTDADELYTVLMQVSCTAALEFNQSTCICTVNTLNIKITAEDQSFTYDSTVKYEDEGELLQNLPYSVLLDKKLTLTFAENGRIRKLDGYEDITNDLNDRLTDNAVITENITQTFNYFINENTLIFLLDRCIGQIPFKTITTDEKFSTHTENVLSYGVNYETTLKYAGFSDNGHVFDSHGNATAGNLTGIVSGKTKIYESTDSGSILREGYEQINLQDGDDAFTFSVQFSVINN